MTNEFNLSDGLAKEVIASCVTGCNQATTHVITANGPVCKSCLASSNRSLVSTVLRDPEGELGQKVICNGFKGVITRVCDGQLSGMVEVRLARGTVCVPYASPDCYPAEPEFDRINHGPFAHPVRNADGTWE